MWLPKDERKLLAFCCTKISRGEAPFSLTHKELEAELRSKGIEADRQLIHEILFKLQNRNLLRWGSALNGNGVIITLYQQGYDLGKKYSSWWTRSNLWYAEYIKNHWIWLIGSFVSGIIATLFLLWLSKVLKLK